MSPGEYVDVSGEIEALETATQVDPADSRARLVGGMWCVDESVFRDTPLPTTTFHQDSMSVSASDPNDNTLYLDSDVFPRQQLPLHVVCERVQGRMNGLGESVQFDENQGRVDVRTHKKDIVGYFSQFGVDAPQG
jgi:hypothetical protein